MKTNSIRRAANELGINNSTAKSIFYKYKQTGQIHKNPRVRGKDEAVEGQHCGGSDDFPMAEDVRMANDEENESNHISMNHLVQSEYHHT